MAKDTVLWDLGSLDVVPFHNQVDYCIGTGRMGLALTKEYMDQLRLVQEYIGFSHIRGHGLFSDDMAIYHEYEEDGVKKAEYNFTYLDLVMDGYRSVGLVPFLELGFMPRKLASGTQTVFYWKGNTTPPRDYGEWTRLVCATLRHLMDRYGADEVVTWPIEVWNEPNLPGFWEHADMQEYFKLFKETFLAIKSLDARFRVGGPAVCGGSDEPWIQGFLDFCKANDLHPDMITRHHYTTELPVPSGHYGYAELMKAEDGFENLHSTREIIDSFDEYRGLPIHITEFNTSYIPNCPLHDTNQNAAYIAHQLSRLGDDNESYSYWTFGDVFEEQGVPFTPFHGGFGLVANGCIPKPTFWTFVFFKYLKEKPGYCIHRDEHSVVMRLDDGSYRMVAFNQSNERTGEGLTVRLEGQLEAGCYCLAEHWVDEESCNPLKTWHDLGEPANPSAAELARIKQTAMPAVRTTQLMVSDEKLTVERQISEHGVVYMELLPIQPSTDRGYDYDRVMQKK